MHVLFHLVGKRNVILQQTFNTSFMHKMYTSLIDIFNDSKWSDTTTLRALYIMLIFLQNGFGMNIGYANGSLGFVSGGMDIVYIDIDIDI